MLETPAETLGLASSHLVRVPNSRSGGHEFESPVWRVHWLKWIKILGVRSFYSGDPDMIMSCLTCSTLSVCLSDSFARRHLFTHKCSTNAVSKGAMLETPAETLGLASSHLVRVPNSRSGGHEFESPVWRVHWLKWIKILGVRSFYSGDPDMIMSCLTCSTLSVCLSDSFARRHLFTHKCSTNAVSDGAMLETLAETLRL